MAAELLIEALEALGVKPDQVEIYDAHLRKHGDTQDWTYFLKVLQLCEEKDIDILYMTSGLKYPPPASHYLYTLLHHLKKRMVLLTSSVLANVITDVYPDFPSESVISIRRHPPDRLCSRGATVDYDLDLEGKLPHYEKIWSGGVACIALITKILIFVDKSNTLYIVQVYFFKNINI